MNRPDIIKPKAGFYTLEFRGDSMTSIGIYDGDTVVIDSNASVKNGDIVVALINREEATMKRYYRMSDYVELRAENPKIKPERYAPSTIEVQGKLVGIFRKY